MASLVSRFLGPHIEKYLNDRFGSTNTRSGRTVTDASPYEIVPIRAAIQVLSQDTAKLPLKLYRKVGRGREDARDHPLFDVLHSAPNPRMTAFEFRESMMLAALTWGNSYSIIQRDDYGRVMALWPIRPDRVSVYIEGGRVWYEYTPTDSQAGPEVFPSSDILHIKGPSSDGLVGRTPLYDFREKFGELDAMDALSQSFYGNGMKRQGVLKTGGTLSDGALARLKKQLENERGTDKAWSTLILEEGMDFSELTFAPEDAQLLDTRRFGVEDACRIYNLPPYKLRMVQPGAVSYASVDAQAIDYLVSSLSPWLVRVEQAINRACLTYEERKSGYFVEHNTRAMLRSDLKAQAEAHKLYVEMNAMTTNEVREDIGHNPYPDPRADDPFTPTYTQAVVAPAEPDTDDGSDDEPDHMQ